VDERANEFDGQGGTGDIVFPVLLNIHQLAKALGVGRTTVENWTRSRRIPSLKIKRVLRYDLQKVLAALAAYERKAIGF
jgi:excisionase family DNA binding protein